MLAPRGAMAHPHAWIDMREQVILNDKNQIVGLHEHWVFDEFYTEFAKQDYDLNHDGKLEHNELVKLGTDNLTRLRDYDFFTLVQADGKAVKIKTFRDVDSVMVGNRVALDFTLVFAAPIETAGQGISYKIYDPSYYIEMKHEKENPVTFTGGAACKFTLTAPKPDISKIGLAATLDQLKQKPQAADNLGSYFAEKVDITCP
jgi:ABC-type uncharacterized transport system substrate-binding protein